MDDENIIITCNGCGAREQADTWSQVKHHHWHRHDYYGLSTGMYCEECYQTNYPFRKDAYFDPGYAGERMDDDN